ncbi:hypothetical protein BH11PLA2_BH11PLA2_20370 [soil metagenome]
MTPFLRGVAQAMIEAFTPAGPVLEVGSYQVDGQSNLINLRSLFPGQKFIGLDIREGPGVDQVGSVEKLPFADESIGCVIAFSAFEHVEHFWHGFEEVHRVLRPDGVFLVSCPFYFRIHNHPSDYWRFTPEAFDVLLRKYPNRVTGWHGGSKRPGNVWAAAFKEKALPPTDQQLATYRRVLAEQTKGLPASPIRKFRYRLGQLAFGKRPFAGLLEEYDWESRLTKAA